MGTICFLLAAWLGAQSENPGLQHEWVGDPPGRAAQASPRTPKAPPVLRGLNASYQVNVDGSGSNISGDAANEPSIAVDPLDPQRMAIGWRQFSTTSSNFRQAGWGYSRDGGRSWTFPGVLESIFRSDPVLEADSAGNFYFYSLSIPGGIPHAQIFSSQNGGVSWQGPTAAFGGDKGWMTIDRTGSIGAGNIYCAWSSLSGCCGGSTFNRSTDGGQSFSTPVAIPSTPIRGTLAVSSDGAVYVGGVDPGDASRFLVAKSTNAKDSLATPAFDFTSEVNLGGSLLTDVGSGPNPVGLVGQTWIAVDCSGGAFDGHVYLLSSVDPPGSDPLDVQFAKSTDGGLTWSAPIRVNDDPEGNWQWFATMSVAPNGRIDVIWNDTRAQGEANLSELYYACSIDAGTTWSANAPVSPLWNSHLGWPNQQKIGDYYDMVSDEVGAHVAYAATFNGEQDVYYLRIGDYDCNANGIGDADDIAAQTSSDDNLNGIPDECETSIESYCTAKTTSQGCVPFLTASGLPSASAGAFNLFSNDHVELETALLFYGFKKANLSFHAGKLCVNPFERIAALIKAFDGIPCVTCSGSCRMFKRNFNTLIQAGSDPMLTIGQKVFAQFRQRDPADPTGFSDNLSDALSFVIAP